MGIIAAAPLAIAVTAIPASGAAAGGVGAGAASFLASTALSMTLSYAAGALQPKASAARGETAGRMVSVSNTGADPRIVILGTFRDAGTLVWHKEHEGHKVKVTQVIQLCDMPIDGYVSEIVDGEITALVGNETQTVRGHEPGGTGFNFGDTPTPDADDWVPPVPEGSGHGDIWRDTTPGELYKLRGKRWEELTGASFHDLPSSDPTSGLGSNGDVAVNRTSGDVFIKRGGFWRLKAQTPGTASAGDAILLENAGVPTDHSRFLHWEDGDRRWRWHFKARYYDGTQTSADSFLTAIADSASEWGSAMIGTGRAYKVVTQRYYPSIFTGPFPVQTASILRGVLVYDPRISPGGASVDWYGTSVTADQIAWTENAALVAAFIKCWPELPGAVPYSEIDEAELIASADICDEVVTNPDDSTEPRYTVNGMVQSTETRDSVEEALEIALGGKIFRRGGKWVIWAGRARSSVATFTRNNIVGVDYDYQPGPAYRERKNTVIGTWFSPNHQYGQMSIKPVRESSYYTADKSQELVESIHFRFAARSRFTPRRQARIWLRNRRNEGNGLRIRLDVEALDLSQMDVFELSDDLIGFDTDRFVVSALESPLLSPAQIGSSLRDGIAVDAFVHAYDPNTWDAPSDDPTEDDPDLPAVRDLTTVDPPASIAVAAVTKRPAVDIDGKLLANVKLQIGRSPDLYATEYEVQYRMSPENFVSPASAIWGDGSDYEDDSEWASVSKVPPAEKDVFAIKLKALYDGAYYDFRVAAHNIANASSDAYENDDWTRQIDAYLVSTGRVALPSGPISGGFTANDVVEGDFEQGGEHWDLVDETATLTATASIIMAGGVGTQKGPHVLQVVATAGNNGDRYKVRSRNFIPVKAGQIRAFWYWAKGDEDIRHRWAALWHDEEGVFIRADNVITNQIGSAEANTWVLHQVKAQVPGDTEIALLKCEFNMEREDSTALPFGIYIDWFGTKDRRKISSAPNQGDLELTGSSAWSTLAEQSYWSDGFTDLDVEATCKAYVEATGTTGNEQRAGVRLIRVDDDDAENQTKWVELVSVQNVAKLPSGATSGDQTARLPGDIVARVPASDLPAGTKYRIRLQGRIKSDSNGGTNAKAVFNARRVKLEPED